MSRRGLWTARRSVLRKAETAANFFLSGAGAFCLLLSSVYIYRNGWAINYIAFLAFGGLLIGSLQMSRSQKLNLSLLILSAGFSLYTLELFLAFSASPLSGPNGTLWLYFPSVLSTDTVKERQRAAAAHGINFDMRSRLEIITDLEKKRIRAYPAMFSSVLLKGQKDGSTQSEIFIDRVETLPLGGVSNAMTVFCNENGDYTLYESDEHGFHNPKGLWHAGHAEIVAVGDSFTHGACVPSDKSFVGVIRTRHPFTVNLGIDDNGPVTMLASLKEYAQFLKPKLVLWFYFEGNDLRDLRREKSSPLLMRYVTSNVIQGVIGKQAQIDEALVAHIAKVQAEKREPPTLKEIVKLHHVVETVVSLYPSGQQDGPGQRRQRYYEQNAAAAPEEELELFCQTLREANKTVLTWGGKLVFVYLPQWERYGTPTLANADRERVLDLVRGLGIPLIDVVAAFTAYSDPLELFPFRLRGHYNAQGHQVVAEEVLRFLSSRIDQ